MPKAFWDKPNPKKKSTPLTADLCTYPNLVDNAAVRRKKK